MIKVGKVDIKLRSINAVQVSLRQNQLLFTHVVYSGESMLLRAYMMFSMYGETVTFNLADILETLVLYWLAGIQLWNNRINRHEYTENFNTFYNIILPVNGMQVALCPQVHPQSVLRYHFCTSIWRHSFLFVLELL